MNQEENKEYFEFACSTIEKIIPEIASDIAKEFRLNYNSINNLITQLLSSPERVNIRELSEKYSDKNRTEIVRLLLKVAEEVRDEVHLYFKDHVNKNYESFLNGMPDYIKLLMRYRFILIYTKKLETRLIGQQPSEKFEIIGKEFHETRNHENDNSSSKSDILEVIMPKITEMFNEIKNLKIKLEKIFNETNILSDIDEDVQLKINELIKRFDSNLEKIGSFNHERTQLKSQAARIEKQLGLINTQNHDLENTIQKSVKNIEELKNDFNSNIKNLNDNILKKMSDYEKKMNAKNSNDLMHVQKENSSKNKINSDVTTDKPSKHEFSQDILEKVEIYINQAKKEGINDLDRIIFPLTLESGNEELIEAITNRLNKHK